MTWSKYPSTRVQCTERKKKTPISNLEEFELDFEVGRGWWGCRAAFITDQWVSERGSPSLLHRGTRQEAILKWDAFPQALSHSWHFGCMCVWLCVVFRVKGGGLCFRPKTRLPPLPCYLFPPPLPLLTLLQLDPVSHLPIHLKAQNTYWDPIWGWGRGAWVGPQQGWNTQQQHDEHKEEVESEG